MASKNGFSSPSQTGRRPRFQPPQMRRHAGRRQARTRINGKTIWLGPWEGQYPSPEAQTKFNHVLEEWHRQRNGKYVANLPTPTSATASVAKCDPATDSPVIGAQPAGHRISVAELLAAYVEYAQSYYRKRDGRQTSSIFMVRRACRVLEPYMNTPADAFGPLRLASLLEQMIAEARLCRKTINATAKCIRRIFRWGVSRELVPGAVDHALRSVAMIPKGRFHAKDYPKVKEIPDKIIEQTLPYLPPLIQDMVQVQRLTGARPGEVCNLMAGDLDTSGDIWIARPEDHKTAHLDNGDEEDREREIFFCPRAQAILKKYLPRPSSAAIFCPREAEIARRRERRQLRKTKLYPSHVQYMKKKRKTKPKRSAGDFYAEHSYRRAIHRACERAGIPKWNPNRMRHTAGTEMKKKHGWDTARIILGQASLSETPVYVERDRAKAIQAMRELG